MRITFDDWTEEPAELRPERMQAFFADDPALGDLSGADVRLGVPRVETLTVENLADHPDVRQYVADQPGDDFHLVRLGCSFRMNPNEPFTSALMEVNLEPDKEGGATPIAWSMVPQWVTATRGLSEEYTLGPKLKLGLAELGAELGAEVKKTEQLTAEDVFLEALAEGTSQPAWQFTRIEQRELRGSYRFAMVVQSPNGAAGRGHVVLSVVVLRKKFGPITYRALFDKRPTREFLLPSRSS